MLKKTLLLTLAVSLLAVCGSAHAASITVSLNHGAPAPGVAVLKSPPAAYRPAPGPIVHRPAAYRPAPPAFWGHSFGPHHHHHGPVHRQPPPRRW